MQIVNLRTEEITKLITQLTDADQERLLKALKVQVLMTKARKIDEATKQTDLSISMNEILSVVSEVRQIRFNA